MAVRPSPNGASDGLLTSSERLPCFALPTSSDAVVSTAADWELIDRAPDAEGVIASGSFETGATDEPKENPTLDGAVPNDFAFALPFSAAEGSEIPDDRELHFIPADGDDSSVADLEPGKGPSIDPAIPDDAFSPLFFSAREVVPPESGSLLVELDPKIKCEDGLGLILADGETTCDACAEPNENTVFDAELDDAGSAGLLLS